MFVFQRGARESVSVATAYCVCVSVGSQRVRLCCYSLLCLCFSGEPESPSLLLQLIVFVFQWGARESVSVATAYCVSAGSQGVRLCCYNLLCLCFSGEPESPSLLLQLIVFVFQRGARESISVATTYCVCVSAGSQRVRLCCYNLLCLCFSGEPESPSLLLQLIMFVFQRGARESVSVATTYCVCVSAGSRRVRLCCYNLLCLCFSGEPESPSLLLQLIVFVFQRGAGEPGSPSLLLQLIVFVFQRGASESVSVATTYCVCVSAGSQRVRLCCYNLLCLCFSGEPESPSLLLQLIVFRRGARESVSVATTYCVSAGSQRVRLCCYNLLCFGGEPESPSLLLQLIVFVFQRGARESVSVATTCCVCVSAGSQRVRLCCYNLLCFGGEPESPSLLLQLIVFVFQRGARESVSVATTYCSSSLLLHTTAQSCKATHSSLQVRHCAHMFYLLHSEPATPV